MLFFNVSHITTMSFCDFQNKRFSFIFMYYSSWNYFQVPYVIYIINLNFSQDFIQLFYKNSFIEIIGTVYPILFIMLLFSSTFTFQYIHYLILGHRKRTAYLLAVLLFYIKTLLGFPQNF